MLRHLKETDQKYINHFKFAFMAGIKMIYGGITSIIHAFLPDVFPTIAERITKGLEEESRHRQVRRQLEEYEKEKIKKNSMKENNARSSNTSL